LEILNVTETSGRATYVKNKSRVAIRAANIIWTPRGKVLKKFPYIFDEIEVRVCVKELND